MVTVDIKVNDNALAQGFRNKGNQVPAELNRFSRDIVNIAHRWVQYEAPRKTGRLKASIKKQNTGNGGFVFVSKNIAPYADFVLDGTRPHDIRPRNKKALFWKGAKHPTKRVHHPGTKSNPFIDRGATNMMPEIDHRIQILEKWLTEV